MPIETGRWKCDMSDVYTRRVFGGSGRLRLKDTEQIRWNWQRNRWYNVNGNWNKVGKGNFKETYHWYVVVVEDKLDKDDKRDIHERENYIGLGDSGSPEWAMKRIVGRISRYTNIRSEKLKDVMNELEALSVLANLGGASV